MQEWTNRLGCAVASRNVTLQILCSTFGFNSIIQVIFVGINISAAFRNRNVVSNLSPSCLSSTERRVRFRLHAVFYTDFLPECWG